MRALLEVSLSILLRVPPLEGFSVHLSRSFLMKRKALSVFS